jgi:hypothetical protein
LVIAPIVITNKVQNRWRRDGSGYERFQAILTKPAKTRRTPYRVPWAIKAFKDATVVGEF